ncbi:TolC family protein [Sedimentibacter sp.]|uniref:TolC family protein n=1 Tax=Sedimentibacter sp. TaxID=1960295 RepID=UPI00289EFEB9|nr:TolC family protein [Sedimentibacter sp.]
MKRKISLLLIMILVLSTLTNVVAAEDTAQIGNVSAENKILELSMNEAVKIATENSREMWKIDDGIKQMQDARRSGSTAKQQAEALMNMSLEMITAMEIDITNNYVETLLAKNGYYIKVAESQMKQLERSREVLIKGIEIGTKSVYYNVLVAEKTIEINQAKLNKANEQLRVVNLKFNNGSSTKAEVLSAEMAIQQAKTDLDSAIDDLNIAKLNLLNMLELPFDTEFVLTDTELSYVPTDKINLDEKIEKAKQDRIEILTAENDLEIQKIETHAYTAYYTSNLRENKWAKEKLKDAELNVPQAYKDVELDVRKTYLNLIKAERSLANMDKTVELAKEAARINKLLYDNGMATSLEVLDADTKLAEVEIGRYQMLAAYNINKLMFDYSDIGTFK